MKLVKIIFVLVVMVFIAGQASANVNQLKLYKEAYPDIEKPKCTVCHVDKLPKKDDGVHDLNAYGLKAIETDAEPTVETYKAIGSHEDFEAEASTAEEVVEAPAVEVSDVEMVEEVVVEEPAE